jgi:UDP-N-acetylmuramate dehydrogenase
MTQHSTVNIRRSSLLGLDDVEIRRDEPLADHTTFRVGGPVSCLARPLTEDGLANLMRRIREEGLPHFILGGGSNLLAPDEPWDVIAVQLTRCCSTITPVERASGEKIRLYVGAGARLAQWLCYCIRMGLGGVEPLVGIPGTVGGALVMNAGTGDGCIADPLLWIDVLDSSGERLRAPRSDLPARYRCMGLAEDWIVLGGCFELPVVSPAQLKARMSQKMRLRGSVQPLGRPSAGCVFKNPSGASAGKLMDRASLKGLRIGDAEISDKHANWIINRGSATARDIMELIVIAERRVFEEFGIRLEREIRILAP